MHSSLLCQQANGIGTQSRSLRLALLLALAGCADVGTFPEDAQRILEKQLVGTPARNLFATYGQPSRSDVEYGHHVYYWESLSASVYTPTYKANTQGYIGNTPYSATTTMAGDPQVSVVPCAVRVGTMVDSDIIEKVQVAGMNCGRFIRR